MKNRLWLIFPAAMAAAVAVAGCGGSGSATPGSGASSTSAAPASAAAPSAPPAASTLAKQIVTALKKASSVHISGSVRQAGQTVRLDLSLTNSGETSGTMSVNSDSFALLATGNHTYIKVSSGFLKYAKLPTGTCTLVCDKYLKLSSGESKSMVGGLSMASFVSSLDNGSTAHPGFRYKSTATINGQPAWQLRTTDGSTAYVAAAGTPYLLRIVAPKSQAGQLDFTNWNGVTIPPPPPASEVISMSQLMRL